MPPSLPGPSDCAVTVSRTVYPGDNLQTQLTSQLIAVLEQHTGNNRFSPAPTEGVGPQEWAMSGKQVKAVLQSTFFEDLEAVLPKSSLKITLHRAR